MKTLSIFAQGVVLATLLFVSLTGSITCMAANDIVSKTSYLVVAPDRGFLGNKTIEERFQEYRRLYPNAQLFFMTRRMQLVRLKQTIQSLLGSGTQQLNLLPVVLSKQEKSWKEFEKDLKAVQTEIGPKLNIQVGSSFGSSYLASELLRDRIAQISHDVKTEHLTLLGWGATDEQSEAGLRDSLTRLLKPLLCEYSFASWSVEVLWSNNEEPSASRRNQETFRRIIDQAARSSRPLLVPYFLGHRAESHMSVEALVRKELTGSRVEWKPEMPDEHPLLAQWMSRASAAFLKPNSQNMGVVILSHGSDQIWNEELSSALLPLATEYDIEISFNMGDPRLLQDAVNRLESRGKNIILIYRLFGLKSSFADSIKEMIGASQERETLHKNHHQSEGHSCQSRIRSGSRLETIGGLEDHPLLADVLLERALSLSHGVPENETVLLVAHGAGADDEDQHWQALLTSLGQEMQRRAARPFANVMGLTLREDWPEKRKEALARIEEVVRQARTRGQRVVAVEARINGPGPTQRLLGHLEIPINDDGLVPHPHLRRIVLEAINSFVKLGEKQTQTLF